MPVSMSSSTIDITSGMHLRDVADKVEDNNFLVRQLPFIVLGRLIGAEAKIHAGEYSLSPAISVWHFLQNLKFGKVKLYPVTIKAGRTLSENFSLVQSLPYVVNTVKDTQELAKLLELTKAEGWFLPDTYFFPKNTTELEVFRRANLAMQRKIDELLKNDNPKNLSAQQIITIASLIEKEAGQDSEKPLVSDVIHNRLERGMRLQIDSTIIYGLGKNYKGNLTKANLTKDAPFNTYTRNGLPPSPITTPSVVSLLSAARPKGTDMLYFVSRNDGWHVFSKTYQEHNKWVDKYQRGG